MSISGLDPSTLNLDVSSYTTAELFQILDLTDEEPTEQDVVDATKPLIDRFSTLTGASAKHLVTFFQQIQQTLIDYLRNETKQNASTIDNSLTDPTNAQTKAWFQQQVLEQKDDPTQMDKVTDRKQKIEIYNDPHVPMKQQQLGVNNVIDTKIAQDTLNPNLENITTRFINLDSQFRQAAGGLDATSTDYTLDLSDHLTGVVTLRLYSVQIPFTWYVIDTYLGNTCFWVTNQGNAFQIVVTPGNYSPTAFVTELNADFVSAGFTNTTNNNIFATYNANNGKITINLSQATDPAGNRIKGIDPLTNAFDITQDPFFTFFDFTGELNCFTANRAPGCVGTNLTFNCTLGWLMGFRTPQQAIFSSPGNTPVAVLDLSGPKYFILVIDDYNQNHINNGLISITELSNRLALPSYYLPTLPTECLPYNNSSNLAALANVTPEEAAVLGVNQANVGNLILDKINSGYGTYPQVGATAPRTLTQAQIYTINQILKARHQTTNFRGKAPTTSDTFALIPIKKGNMSTGEVYVDFSGSLQDNKRVYFGPVNIDRIHVKLLDDRGNVVDLHGADWCVTLISENLYQY